MQVNLFIRDFRMKNKVKKIIGGMIFLCLLGIVFMKITYLFSETGREREAILGIKEEGPLDMVYVGASAAYTSWQPLKAWHDCGFTSYTYATGGLPAVSVEHYIKEVLKTKTPELFVVDARPFLLWENNANAKIRYGSDAMDYSLNRFALVKDFLDYRTIAEDDDRLSYYFQIVKYHSNYKDVLASEDNWRLINNKETSKYKGWTFMEYHCPLEMPKGFATKECKALKEENLRILNDLLSYCKEKELKVLFVVYPYAINTEDQKQYNTLQKVVEDAGFDFFNTNFFYEEMNLDFQTDFNDRNHLNCFGAEKYTNFLEKYLVENYTLPDHRGYGEYNSWDELYLQFKEDEAETKKNVQEMIDNKERGEKAAELLPTVTDPIRWAALANNNNFTALISTVGQWKADDIELCTILDQFGIKESDDRYVLKVISGYNDELLDLKGDESIKETCEIGKAETVHGESSVEITSGLTGSLSVDDIKYVFDADGIYVGIYNNNTSQMIDLVRIICQNKGMEIVHLGV